MNDINETAKAIEASDLSDAAKNGNLKYLALKNKLFFKTGKMLRKLGLLEGSVVYMKDEGNEFFDLVALYFEDEEKYQRALFIPWPVVLESRRRIARLMVKMIRAENVRIVSRDWHDMGIREKPENYYPPAEFYEEEWEEEVA